MSKSLQLSKHPLRWAALAILLVAVVVAAQGQDSPGTFLKPGNILIADQFNNRIIVVGKNHNIVWTFGNGSSVAGPRSVVAPNDVQTVGQLLLIAGTGAPPGAEPTCPNGCPDNRVMLVNQQHQIVWQYGQAGVTGSRFNQLNTPVQNTYLPNNHILITDQGNQRVIEVNMNKKIVWQYGQTGIAGNGFNQLNNPNSAELLDNGHVLIADESNNRVIEVTRSRQIVWEYSNGISGAAFASRLPNGDTLITDSLNNRALEVTADKQFVWQYVTNMRQGSVANPNPTRAVRLMNGNTLISDQFNHQVIEVDTSGDIVFAQGQIAMPGKGVNQLNAPYDAKVIGDFTGLTPP